MFWCLVFPSAYIHGIPRYTGMWDYMCAGICVYMNTVYIYNKSGTAHAHSCNSYHFGPIDVLL